MAGPTNGWDRAGERMLSVGIVVNRRQFLLGGHQSEADRAARCQALEAYVQSELLPTEFELTEKEGSDLSSRVRSFLEGASNRDLFSTRIVDRLKLLVEDVIGPWQMAAERTSRPRPQELWIAAIESVPLFLNAATREEFDVLLKRFSLINRVELEARLREDVAKWIQHAEAVDLTKHDAVSIQGPVFEHLRRFLS